MTTKITEQNISELANAGVNWQAVFTGDGSTGLTAVAGRGYFIDTTSGTVTVTLPASPNIGDTIAIKDYAGTFSTNNLTIGRNGNNIQGVANNSLISTNRASIILVYVDATKGWLYTVESNVDFLGPTYITATGGTVTESGDYKIHTFTGDGCFVVSSIGNPIGGSDTVDYLVVAGGGGGGSTNNAPSTFGGAGGGAGGYRESSGAASGCYTVSPLGACVAALPVSVTTYPVTVGGGGGGTPVPSGSPGTPGSNSVFSTITSAGGGGGASRISAGASDGENGGSGGGGGTPSLTCGANAGLGNSPAVSPPQGNPGAGKGPAGNALLGSGMGGGGGATAPGVTTADDLGGGAGATSSITASPVARAGGGGGKCGPGGLGGGGAGSACGGAATAGTVNTGGGGGGGSKFSDSRPGESGGKGIVIIRYKFQ